MVEIVTEEDIAQGLDREIDVIGEADPTRDQDPGIATDVGLHPGPTVVDSTKLLLEISEKF